MILSADQAEKVSVMLVPPPIRSSTVSTSWSMSAKALIHEEIGDGIISAVDFSMDLRREPDPNGDRAQIVMNVKFLPYKMY